LVTPDRQRTLLAKLVAAALVGLAVSAAACALTAAVAVPWFGAEGISLDGRADDRRSPCSDRWRSRRWPA